jgi:hypothetical protein
MVALATFLCRTHTCAGEMLTESTVQISVSYQIDLPHNAATSVYWKGTCTSVNKSRNHRNVNLASKWIIFSSSGMNKLGVS